MDNRLLSNRKILLIVGGGIAAYKALELVRLIKKVGGEVRAVLTAGGAAFVLGAILLVPLAWLSKLLVQQYRARIMTSIEKWKIMQMLKASKLFALYEKLN